MNDPLATIEWRVDPTSPKWSGWEFHYGRHLNTYHATPVEALEAARRHFAAHGTKVEIWETRGPLSRFEIRAAS